MVAEGISINNHPYLLQLTVIRIEIFCAGIQMNIRAFVSNPSW